MRVLITGSNGFIARHIINYLMEKYSEHIEITGVDISEKSSIDGIKYVSYDILNNAQNPELYTKLNEPDAIIHTAWQNGFSHNDNVHLESLPKHYSFITNMIDAGCKNISIMGTMHEVGYFEGAISSNTPCNPMNLYGIAKNSLRQAILTYIADKDVLIKWLRAYYITGDDEHNKSIFSKILQFEKEGKASFPFTDGENKYDFIDIDVLAKQIATVALQDKFFGILNVCSGEPVKLKDKVEEFIKEKGLKIRPEYGVFPTRDYDSPIIYGDATMISAIMENVH